MEKLLAEYELSLYSEIKTILEGKVYIVSHEITNQLYIKKVLHRENLSVYKVLKEMKSQNRPEVVEYFPINDKLIVIEELVNGRTVENILEIESIAKDEAIRIMIGICDGLLDIHRRDNPIIHRDIKPSNIIINSDGVIKLIDFDAARVVNELNNRDTRLIGTSGYASPEQFGFAQTDIRSDIYSMGVLLNYLLVKKLPSEELVSGEIGEIIKKAIQIDRGYRYQDVEEFKKALLLINLKPKKDSRSNVLNTQKLSLEKPKDKKEPEGYMTFGIQSQNKDEKNKKERKYTRSSLDMTLERYLRKIVGFRSFKVYKMILASCWYLIAFLGFLVYSTSHQISDISLVIYFAILPTFIFGGGFGINKYLPLMKSKTIWKKIIGQIIMWFILTMIAGAFMGAK